MKRLHSLLTAFSRLTLASIFWLAVRVFHRVKIHGLEHATAGRKQPAFFAMVHKRNLDPMVEVPSILAHRGWSALARDVHFAMRSDAFSPGFLARLVMQPRWFARFLRPISVRPILRHLGIRPIEKLPARPAEMWIRDALGFEGDLPSGDVLTPAFLQQVAVASGEDYQAVKAHPLSHLLGWRYQQVLQPFRSVDIFVNTARRHAKNFVLSKLKQELVDLQAWMLSGGSLWLAPEGQISPTGAIYPITAVLQRLLQAGPPGTCVIPVFIIYDFMTVRRSAIFVDLAPAIEHALSLSPHELDSQLRRSWLLSARFTCSQLASGFLVETSRKTTPIFTLDELIKEIERQAAKLVQAGRNVDQRLLNPRTSRKLAAGFLKYAVHHGLVRRERHHRWIATITESDLNIQVPPGEAGYSHAPLAYAWNELQDMLSIDSLAKIDAAS